MSNWEKGRLLRSTLLAGLAVAGFSGVASAQENQQEEVITVTGSRIQQPNMTAPTNVNVYNSEQIQLTGAVNVSEVLRTLPAAGVSGLTSTNSNFTTQGSGINTVELRNLGESRTLVLVNGRRFVSGSPGTQTVDFNAIPTDLIERVDVVTGGASAVYGSDAVAGVVNIILQDDFEGVKTAFQAGITEAGDDETYKATVTMGSNFADGRGNAVFSTTWERENGVFARDREGMEVDCLSRTALGAGPAEEYKENICPFYSSFSEKGRFNIVKFRDSTLGGTNYVLDGSDVRAFSSSQDGFNRQAFRALSVPTERVQVSSLFNYDLNANHRLFAEATYASTESKSSLEPFPLDGDGVYGGFKPGYVDTNDDDIPDTGLYGIPFSNPFIPAEMRDLMRQGADLDGDGVQDIADDQLVLGFSRRMTELDQRGASNLRQTFRIVGGLEGTLKDRYNYEFSLNYGRTTQAQRSTGQINVLNMRKALDVESDGAGGYQCSDPVARAEGCLPVNLFGEGSITAGLGELERRNLLAWLKAPATRQATVEQFIVSGFISGPAFDLPAGPVMFAVGGEYRDESSDNRGDALTATGQNASNKSPDSVGQFDVSEGFIELDIPVLSGLALADSLDVNLAARFSDYSTVGSTQAYAASFDWVVNDYVRARGQLSRAVRAPNISELFAPLGQTFPNVVDPCRDVSAGSTGTFDAACRQDPDVAARIARDGSLNLSQSELQGVSGFNGGALSGGFELEAETSDSYSVGLMFSPAFVPALEPLSISVDYFNIKIEDAISTIGRQTALNECYSADGGYDANSNFCSLIQRWNTGSFLGALQFVNSYSQNVATTETSGIDVQASYLFDFNDIFSNMSTDIGTLNVSVVYAYLDKFDTVPFEGADVVDSKGTVGLPEHEAQIALVYNRGPLTLALDTQFIGESVFSNNENNAFFGPKIAPHAFTDLQARYDLGQTQLFFGVDNILDEYVPLGFSTPPTSTGWDTAPDVYDGLGRRFYGGVRHTF